MIAASLFLSIPCGLIFALDGATLASTSTVVETAAARSEPVPRWDARAAEHLLNRAGFGGTREDVERLVRMSQTAAVESLFADPAGTPKPEILARTTLPGGLESPTDRHATVERRREGYVRLQPDLIIPLNRFGDWWIERMLRSDDPVRDHMAIFWHGHFVSSVKEVGNSQDMIAQIQFLRDNALGSFEKLARGLGRDVAMLRYLNNDTNVKDHPNENWARELMELFSLGDGNYTETDIKQSARAYTGWSSELGAFIYRRIDHDFGQKTFLGVTGNLDGDHVVDVILQQPACGSFLARKIIAYFEGTVPTPERVDDYADFLRQNDYHIGKMLRRLFNDPAFYRDEIVASRVAGPIEYLIGAARRLELDVPGQMALNAGDVLGQRLFWPPSVKGWEEGLAWITTATMMHRSNMVGIMLGLVDVKSLMRDEEFDAPEMMDGGEVDKERKSRTNGFNHLYYIQKTGWQPTLALFERARKANKASDADVAAWMLDELLAIPVTPDMARGPAEFLREKREAEGLAAGKLAADPEKAEKVLRELAHFILSQPEAQLN